MATAPDIQAEHQASTTESTGYPFPSEPAQLQPSSSPAFTPLLTPSAGVVQPTTPGSVIPPSTRGKARPLYISILLDGDADLFQYSLYGRKSSGGKDAAHRLLNQVREFVVEREGGSDPLCLPKVLAKVFMNQRGLAQYLLKQRAISSPSDLTAFIHGFNNSGLAFSIIDTGEAEQSADQAIKLHFDHLIAASDYLFLGGLHSPTNARLLLTYHPLLRDKVILLQASAKNRKDPAYHAVKGSERKPLEVVVSEELFAEDTKGAAVAMDAFYADWEEEEEKEHELDQKDKDSARGRLQRSVSAKSALAPILDTSPVGANTELLG
ncbi:hypothetical protein BCR35DRAFT_330636 [Leucosporidium creatinivorum]|uniref:DUF7923 domain-containing protein n=1 Tax=Leucosporidium creatinivorum TaxID=106004 RepID=A0A1Y2FU86_9BASI|nr:hypothetical protein BCR35DRAFT_330636 [Leucosporidium creatinivorum]